MKGNFKHGGRHTRLYNIWRSMRQRCSNSHTKNYKNYGARGIRVCDEWNDFTVFSEWAKSSGYNDSMTIDRIDNDGDYSPMNCRWATYQEQARNKRNTALYEHNGESHTLMEWEEVFGIPWKTMWARIHVYGWNVEEALTSPKHINQYDRNVS